MVFDVSAKCNDSSLNDMIYEGPKLKRELFDMLLHSMDFTLDEV